MMFNVDMDSGDAIVGWLVPDNPNEPARLKVYVPDSESLDLDATISRQDVVDFGIHNTGMVGFLLSDEQLPELRSQTSLELRDAVSNTLIYKRFDASRHVAHRVIYFDASVIPQEKMFRTLRSKFAMNYSLAQALPYETLNSIVRIPYSNSIFISGRPNYMRYAAALKDQNFVITALLRNPFDELAERLLFLNLLSRSKTPGELENYATGLLPLTSTAADFPFKDDRAMEKAFRNIPKDLRLLLRDPMTRMLACNIDEPVKRNHVTMALDNLASMSAVGTYDHFPEFKAMVAGVLNANLFQDLAPETFRMVRELSDNLAKLGTVRDLLENDLALYSYAEEAMDTGLAVADKTS